MQSIALSHPNSRLATHLARQWLDLAGRQALAFSQVREDSTIDGTIVAMLGTDLKGLMVASGGCTLAHLVALERFANLDVVDINQSQLALSRLKVQLLTDFTPSERLAILGHQSIRSEQRRRLLLALFDKLSLDKSSLGDFDLICELGPDNCGRYEMVFSALRAHLASVNDKLWQILALNSALKQSLFLRENPDLFCQIEKAFALVFSHKNLCGIFGEKACANRAMSFHKHFAERTRVAFETLPTATNPYLLQVLSGGFQGTNFTPWLAFNRPFHTPEIAFYCEAMCNYIQCQADNRYDFVHLSNILDWLSKEEAEKLLFHAYRVLQPHGMLVIRQLNSNLAVRELNGDIIWLKDLSSSLHKQDRSFFYSNLHIGSK